MDSKDRERLDRRKLFVRRTVKGALEKGPLTKQDIRLLVGSRITDEELEVGLNDLYIRDCITCTDKDGLTYYGKR